MEIMIPLIIVGAVFFQAYLYAKAIYTRRMVMRKRVENFLEREDASKHLKCFAVHAFHDAVSIKLPFGMIGFQKKRKNNDPAVRKAEKKFNEVTRKDVSSAQARQELDSIIEMMFTINLSFNQPLFLLACLGAMTIKVERKDASKDFYLGSMNSMHPR